MTPIDGRDRRDKRVGIVLDGKSTALLAAMTGHATSQGVPVRQWARSRLLDAAGFQDYTRRRVSRRPNTQLRGETATVQNPFQIPVSDRERAAIKDVAAAAGADVTEWAWDVLVKAYRKETRKQKGKQR